MQFGKIDTKRLKTIAFDLDTKALQEYYLKDTWQNAYADITTFLAKKGFKHSQGSVYDSITKFSDNELEDLIEKMGKKLIWLPHCITSIRGYDQPVIIDYTKQLQDNTMQNLSLKNKKEKKS